MKIINGRGIDQSEAIISTRHLLYNNDLRWAITEHNGEWTLEVEMEFIDSVSMENVEKLTLGTFIQKLKSSKMFSCIENIPVEKFCITDSSKMCIDGTRPFSYVATSKVIYTCPKLDGIKYNCIINDGYLYVPQINRQIAFEKLKFNMCIGSVEVVDNVVYLIDLLGVYFGSSFVHPIGHLDAIEILKSFDEILTNVFFDNVNQVETFLEETNIKCDGYLEFTRNEIVKRKSENTIDLIYIKPPKKCGKLINNIYFAPPCKENSLAVKCPDWKISNVSTNHGFQVYEFKIDSTNKQFIFFRERNDKIVANKFKTFKQIIKLEQK